MKKKAARSAPTRPAAKRTAAGKGKSGTRLLSGGNPQIAMGEGDAPVQAYIAAMPGWKRMVGEQIDALVTRAVPGVRKAVKWNSPLYGIAGNGWFLSVHCFTHYVKVAFFKGSSLTPPPPGPAKDPNTRYLDIREDEPLDAAQFTRWLKQASRLPGWKSSKTD
jgi:hypothetical protein